MLSDITRPTLLIHYNIVMENLRKMFAKTQALGIPLRPHVKTHQNQAVANWMAEEGIDRITVSSLSMAVYFIRGGWNDVTLGFPFNIRETGEVNKLNRNVKLNLLVDQKSTVHYLGKYLEREVGLYIKVDTGSHRAGIPCEDTAALGEMTALIHRYPQLQFKGFLTHNGLCYQARGKEEVLKIHANALAQLASLKEAFPEAEISAGDTPSASLAEDFGVISELRPGNFMYYDLMQVQIGSCAPENIAIALACPVAALYPARREILIYGGAVHLSKESLDEDGRLHYGKAVRLVRGGWDTQGILGQVDRLSQEHGIIRVEGDWPELQVGELLGILPVHSCLTADLMRMENRILWP